MQRLQKKCFVFSVLMHGLLLAALLFGPAFLTRKEKSDFKPKMDFISAKLVDTLLSQGGDPTATPPSPVVAPAEIPAAPEPRVEPKSDPPAPVPTPVVPVPDPPTPVPVPAPERPAPKSPPKRDETTPAPPKKMAKVEPVAPVPEKRTPVANTKTIVRSTADKEAQAKKAREAEDQKKRQQAMEKAAKAATGALQNLNKKLSTGVNIGTPGPGGEAFTNYGDAVVRIYEDAWVTPRDASDESLIVPVSVTIARDGHVIAKRILRKSGISAMDRSVQRTLDRVDFIAPFPEGATDAQRTFDIDFNLKAKRSSR